MKLLHQGDHKLSLKYRGRLDFPLHLQNAVELILLTSGRSTVQCDGRKYVLTPGDFLVVFPNQVHSFEDSADALGYVMIIPLTPYLNAYESTLVNKRPANPVLPKGTWEHTGLEKQLEFANTCWPDASDNVRQGYVLVIMGLLLPLLQLSDAHPGNSAALEATLLYLHEHYHHPFSRKELAKAVGYNESYISHIFTDTLNVTLSDYIMNLRVQDAAKMLRSSTLPVSQIAGSTGFGSIRSFNRAFIRVMKFSPSQYRHQSKKI